MGFVYYEVFLVVFLSVFWVFFFWCCCFWLVFLVFFGWYWYTYFWYTYRIHWEYSENTFGKIWEYFCNTLGIVWMYLGKSLGIFWEYIGNTLGIVWAYFGNTLWIRWKSVKIILDISKLMNWTPSSHFNSKLNYIKTMQIHTTKIDDALVVPAENLLCALLLTAWLINYLIDWKLCS